MNKKYLSDFLKHQTIIIVVSLILVILITGSVSHAYFTASVKGTPTSVKATSGSLNITFSSSPSSTSSKIYIQSDSDSGQTNPYTLTVKNGGTVAAAYDIVVTATSGTNNVNASDIKYQLTKTGESSNSTSSLSSSRNVIKHVTSISPNGTDTYSLKIWVSSSMTESSQESALSGSKKVNLQVQVVSKASAVSSQLSSIS